MCQAFAHLDNDVTLLVPNKTKEYEQNISDVWKYYGVEKKFSIVRFPHNYRFTYDHPISLMLSTGYIAKKFIFEKPDLVYGRDLFGCHLSSSLGIPTIYENHAPPLSKDNSLRYKALLRIMSSKSLIKFVVVTKTLQSLYEKSGIITRDKIYVAPDGADHMQPSNQSAQLHARPGILQVGYVGSLYRGRGITLIRDLAQAMPDVDFHLVGGKQRDLDRWNTQEKPNNFNMYGHIPPGKLSDYYHSFDILLSPHQENVHSSAGLDITKITSPIKIFEYMASKRPMICSNLPVFREVLNEENSLLVPPNDLQEWIDAIHKLKNKTTRRKIAHTAFNDFTIHYSWKQRAKNLLELAGSLT